MLFPTVVSSWVWIFVLALSKCAAILTGNSQEHEDITSLPKYGCHWLGGSSGMVNCTCREDTEEFFIHRGQIPVYDTWSIQINNCKKVIFGDHSIEDLRNLRHVHLKNIPSLTLLPESFSWFGYRATYQSDDDAEDDNIPSLSIVIENCTIEKVSQHTFKGRIKVIELNDCDVKDMESFSFSSLRQSESIILKSTIIDTLKPQAFKLFTTKQLILDGVSINEVPSRAFSNLVVKEKFQISNSKFETLHSGCFIVDGPKWFEVVNSNISVFDGEAFTVAVKGDVLFKNNNFGVVSPGAFIKIVKSKDLVLNTALFLTLDSNVFSYLWGNSLDVNNGLVLKFVNLTFNESCNCDIFMSTYAPYKDFFSEIKCLDSQNYISIKNYNLEKCTILSGHTTMIVIIGVICLLLLIMIILLSLYYHKVFREGKYGKSNAPQKNVSLIVPDGRTYRETEVHVILERADLLTTDL